MKKFLLSIMTLIYLTVSSGVAMEIHYCMGKQAGVDFYHTGDDKKCGRCGMKEKKGGCCNDEHKFYKLADVHNYVSNNYDASISHVAIISGLIFFPGYTVPAFNKEIFHLNPSPPDSGPLIFIRNRVFRI